jgi:peptide/nickel transport system permease protein
MAGLAIVLLTCGLALFAPIVAAHDPTAHNIDERLLPPVGAGGTWAYPLGTDGLGRDILSRIVHGARVSFSIGLSVVAVAGLCGTALGLLAGYRKGMWDAVIMRVGDVQLAIPTLVLALALMAVVGPRAGVGSVVVVLVVTSWITYARVVRAEALTVREKEYVQAAQAVGARDLKILVRHILPNVSASLIVIASLEVGRVMLAEAALSFLGLGIQPPTPTWGGMIADGRDLVETAWWVSTFPGLAIVTAVWGLNLFGDWLRDVLDPRQAVRAR